MFLIAYDFQSFRFIVLLHEHGRQDGLVGCFSRFAGAGAVKLAAQNRQRAEAARLIVQPPADLHRKVVVRKRLALDCISVLAVVRIRD